MVERIPPNSELLLQFHVVLVLFLILNDYVAFVVHKHRCVPTSILPKDSPFLKRRIRQLQTRLTLAGIPAGLPVLILLVYLG